MKVRTSGKRGQLRNRIVKGPIADPSRGSRSFRRRRLMRTVKEAHRRLVSIRQDPREPVLPRVTEKFRALWRLQQ
jgi:hypothetical protein